MPLPRIALIGVPSSAGARRTGQELGPAAFRAARLTERLRTGGVDVADFGDLAPECFRPDPEHPRQQNRDLVVAVAQQVADQVDRAVADDRVPLVVGGDCTLSLGVIAGLLRHHASLGLVYFDGDVDLNTPETTPSGVFEGMVLAHALGGGARELAEIGPRLPMLDEADVVLFGYDTESGWVDPYEIETLNRSRMSKYPLASIRDDPTSAAREALRRMEANALLIHFDIDVTDSAAADVPHPRGLDVTSALAALGVFTAAPNCAAVAVTEYNGKRDPDGSRADRFVAGLVEVLANPRRPYR